MVNYTILAGGFSSVIATYFFDAGAKSLTLTQQNPSGENPSWIAQHPNNSLIIYAVNEIQPVGNLQSFSVGDAGLLSLVDTVTTGGNGPTFTNPLSTGEVTGMNFGSPNCSFVATVPDNPLHFEKDSPIINFPAGPNAASNPHMSLEHNGEVFVPDLGADKIWRIVNDGAPGKFRVQGQIDIDSGAGPRHIAIHDDILFTVHEKTSTLTAQHIPEAPNGTTFPLLANVSVVPANPPEGTSFAAAEILISTPTERFPTPLIYVSNRNIGTTIDPAGDTIAIFQFNNGTSSNSPCTESTKQRMKRVNRIAKRGTESLELLAQVPTGLQQIRSMSLGKVEDGGDEFIIAGANTVGGVVILQRVEGGRNLVQVARNEDIANRTSFIFL
ncbi:Lactonase, 7-bladed beta-propeller-domain-containing protein [Armillaria mellea]|nr:Lactonase, 7-bladed beta-propeller-domain-containing protein [Armillaria mellea]